MAAFDPFAAGRKTSFRWDVLDLNDKLVGELDAEGGSVDWNLYREIRTTGSVEWKGTKVPDWLVMRLQPWIIVELPSLGRREEWPLGVFIPSTPDVEWSATYGSESVDLYDKLQVLVDSKIGASYSLAEGTNVVAAVRTVINDAGEPRMAITDSSETLRSAKVWEPGTSRLRIVNDLLETINYFSLWVDGWGVFQGQPYTAPETRGITREFKEGADRLFIPKVTHSRDTFSVPNVVNLISSSAEGDGPTFSATYRNDDEDDPLSTVRRRREIVVTETDVEVTSQAVLDQMVKRRFAEMTQVASTVHIEHAAVPLNLNDVVRVQDKKSSIDLNGVVQSITYELSYKALMQTRVREVVNVK